MRLTSSTKCCRINRDRFYGHKPWGHEIKGVHKMFQVIKRDGSKADFTLTKINDAIMKAFTATQMSYNNDIIDLLALRVTADFQKKVENDEIHVEDIQDSVERVLGQATIATPAISTTNTM